MTGAITAANQLDPHSNGNLPARSINALNNKIFHMTTKDALKYTVDELFTGNLALVSSFGSASVVLLHMVSKIAPDLPVLFIDTEKHFAETIDYRNKVGEEFGLTNIQSITPNSVALANTDPDGHLWQSNPDACCALRKTAPLDAVLKPYAGWITGRKRYQNGQRQELAFFERDNDKIKINPLANWNALDVADYVDTHNLPRHPLIAKGYPSIGCAPCTSPVLNGEDERAGRWRGAEKTECGIHFTTNQQTEITSAPADAQQPARGDTQRRIKSWA